MEDLLIIQKIEDMMRYGYQAVAHFPKSERHVMSQEIRLAMWRLMRGAVLCAKRYYKKTTLCYHIRQKLLYGVGFTKSREI
jgi:hypothetical protein